MNHAATITNNPDGFGQPFHVQCSCNTAGDFPTQQAAADWITYQHFARLGSTETFSLTPSVLADLPHSSPAPVSAPATPPESGTGAEPPIGGVV